MMSGLEFVIFALAVWRLSSLLANEHGPAKMFEIFRDWICAKFPGEGNIGDGLTCEWCNSVWIGIVTTVLFFLVGNVLVWFYLPFALSTVTIMLKYFREKMEKP
jgi:hypothetical protein